MISSLAQKNAHVPYRNSKLTQSLQDSLGKKLLCFEWTIAYFPFLLFQIKIHGFFGCYTYLGRQAKTLMFVHISPELDVVGETLRTLNFAERAASVKLGDA